MEPSGVERKLTTILSADVAGYSRLMGEDEEGTLRTLNAYREVIDGLIADHRGRVFASAGDSVVAEFASAVEAVRCAVEIQQDLEKHNADLPEERRMRFRIGVNLGDVIVEGDNLFGDGVNVAARLESLAEPGGICIAANVFEQVENKLDLGYAHLGEQEVKNIAKPVRVYQVLLAPEAAGKVVGELKEKGRSWRWAAAVAGMVVVVAGIVLWQRPWEPTVEPASVERMAFPLPDKPSIAVLPFVNVSDDPEQEHFADGMTDDLITDLSKVAGLFVIARNSVFTYKGSAVKVQQVAEELGVGYVLEGSVRRAGGRLRINAQLIEATTGRHLWAERYDRNVTDIFALQDKVVGEIVSALAVKLTDAEQKQIARLPTDNLEAYDYYLRAEQEGFYIVDTDRFRRTLSFYEKAIELDPEFADAHAGYARAAVEIWRLDYNNLLAGAVARKRAYEAAGRALARDPDNARAYSVLALLQLMDGRHGEAIASARAAVSFHPNYAEAYVNLGLVLAYSGRPAEAVAAIETALRLNPNPPPGVMLVAGIIFFTDHQYERAIEALEAARDALPTGETAREYLASAYAQLGRLDEAKAEVDRLLEVFPPVNLAYYRVLYSYYKREEDRAHHLEGLQKAGMVKWPFGFEGRDEDRLDGSAITALVFGRTWIGKLANGVPFVQEIGETGEFAYRSATSFLTGTAQVETDMLCHRIDGYLLGRTLCGHVYRNPSAAQDDHDEYVHVSPDTVKYFSVTE